MRASGVIGAALTVVLTAACGGDDSDDNPKGSGGASGSAGRGGTPSGMSGASAGTSDGGSDAAAGEGGALSDAGRGGSNDATAGQAGNANVGGNYDPEDAEPMDPEPITFTVTGSEGVHAISPLIYGANMAGLTCSDSKARFSFCRHRSAAWSTYNWETNASNAGASRCNENNEALSKSDAPGAAITDLMDEATGNSASAIVTLPMLDYVAADKSGGSAAPDCSGDVSKSASYLTTRFKQNRLRKGAPLSLAPDTNDDYVNTDELVSFLSAHAVSKSASLLFGLDNQIELWHLEHPKLQSAAISYVEAVARNVDYATVVKDIAPDAEVLGFVGYGYLAAKSLQDSPDYAQEGEFLSYYLREMAAASETDGRRLIDYVDLHWFSEIYADNQRVIEEGTRFDTVLARVQGPRSFWDPTYIENSWITNLTGKPVLLFDWLKRAVDDNYPGTKLALSEWSFGGGTHISGAVAAADALGLFGQKGIDLAGVVSFSPADEPYLIGAFQAFRNYDGSGASFGDTSVAATSSNPHHGTIYASIDESEPSRMVLVAINRRAGDLITTLSIDHSTSYTKLTPYVVRDGQPEPKLGKDITAGEANQFELTIPGYSVWVLVPGE